MSGRDLVTFLSHVFSFPSPARRKKTRALSKLQQPTKYRDYEFGVRSSAKHAAAQPKHLARRSGLADGQPSAGSTAEERHPGRARRLGRRSNSALRSSSSSRRRHQPCGGHLGEGASRRTSSGGTRQRRGGPLVPVRFARSGPTGSPSREPGVASNTGRSRQLSRNLSKRHRHKATTSAAPAPHNLVAFFRNRS